MLYNVLCFIKCIKYTQDIDGSAVVIVVVIVIVVVVVIVLY